MRRLFVLLAVVAMNMSASAQFKGSVTIMPQEPYTTYQISFNLGKVCESMGVDCDEFGPILDQWLYVNRDKNTEYENMKLVYLTSDANHPQAVGNMHGNFSLTADGSYVDPSEWNKAVWGCMVVVDLKLSTLSFNVFLMSGAFASMGGTSPVKAGDELHASFAIAFNDKVATFDVSMKITDNKNGVEIPLISLDKVGEKAIAVKYVAGKDNTTSLNLDSIANFFGEGVQGGNLQLYVYSNHKKNMLTDRYTYESSATVALDDNCVEMQDIESKRFFLFGYYPLPQYFIINPNPSAFADGEHATGSVFLVAEGKYFELKLDVQFGDSEQEARNQAVVAAAETCGKFTRVLTVEPSTNGISQEAIAAFSLSTLAKALGVDKDELFNALTSWKACNEMADGSEMIYNLSDHASTKYSAGIGGYNLMKDGRVADYPWDWQCMCSVDAMTQELKFSLLQMPNALENGEVCNVQLGVYYHGRMVELEIIMNVKDGNRGELIALSSLKKVGEQVVSGIYSDPTNVLKTTLDLDHIASLFDNDVAGKSLKLYIMSDADKQLLTDRYSYETAPSAILNIESTELADYNSHEYYVLGYYPYENLLIVNTHPDAFKGGQKTSGSVFLVADGQYYELMMDIQFGSEQDEKEYLNILATEPMSVRLMLTDNFYTYLDRQTGELALVQTAVGWSKVTELLGTENPLLYAEQKQDGNIIYSCRYNAAPGQGFWFTPEGNQAYRGTVNSQDNRFGVYFSDGSFKWYENPFSGIKNGESYDLHLYLCNPAMDTAVKYEITVEFVEDLSNPELCHIHRLPVGMNISTGFSSFTPTFPSGNTTLFDLQGRPLSTPPTRGMYIQNGKKVIK